MIGRTVKQLNYRAARNWAKIFSSSGPWIYTVEDRSVSNNKPHITVKCYKQPAPIPFMYTAAVGEVALDDVDEVGD